MLSKICYFAQQLQKSIEQDYVLLRVPVAQLVEHRWASVELRDVKERIEARKLDRRKPLNKYTNVTHPSYNSVQGAGSKQGS